MKRLKPSYVDFDHIKFKGQLRKYSLVGEVGVLSYHYSKEIVKRWRFKTPELAKNIITFILDLQNYFHFYLSQFN